MKKSRGFLLISICFISCLTPPQEVQRESTPDIDRQANSQEDKRTQTYRPSTESTKSSENALVRVQGNDDSYRESDNPDSVESTDTVEEPGLESEVVLVPVLLNISVFTDIENEKNRLEQQVSEAVLTAFSALDTVRIVETVDTANWMISIVVLENRNATGAHLGYSVSYVFLPLRILMTETHTSHGLVSGGSKDFNWLADRLSGDFVRQVIKRDEAAASELRSVLDFLFQKTLEAYEYELKNTRK